jgi:hypothetical protein
MGGIWFFDPLYSCYSFMPFYAGWGSPYGSSYPFSFHRYYWWEVRNSLWGTQRGYFPSIGNIGTTGVYQKANPVTPSIGTVTPTRGTFSKGGGGKVMP